MQSFPRVALAPQVHLALRLRAWETRNLRGSFTAVGRILLITAVSAPTSSKAPATGSMVLVPEARVRYPGVCRLPMPELSVYMSA